MRLFHLFLLLLVLPGCAETARIAASAILDAQSRRSRDEGSTDTGLSFPPATDYRSVLTQRPDGETDFDGGTRFDRQRWACPDYSCRADAEAAISDELNRLVVEWRGRARSDADRRRVDANQQAWQEGSERFCFQLTSDTFGGESGGYSVNSFNLNCTVGQQTYRIAVLEALLDPPRVTAVSVDSTEAPVTYAVNEPARGSADRNAILGVARREIRRSGLSGRVEFQYVWLRRSGDWAFFRGEAARPGGGRLPETYCDATPAVQMLLRRDGAAWQVVRGGQDGEFFHYCVSDEPGYGYWMDGLDVPRALFPPSSID